MTVNCVRMWMLALIGLGLAQPVQAQGTRTVVGQVFAANDSTPLSGVHVTVIGQPAQTESDQSGRFVLANLPRKGPWLWGDIDTSADGVFSDNDFVAWIADTVGARVRTDTLRGVRQDDAWQVIALDQCEGPTGADRCRGARPIIFRGTMVQQPLP